MQHNDMSKVKEFYRGYSARVTATRQAAGRPLTFAEKVLFSHLAEPLAKVPARGKDQLALYPDRVAMQDATAQMALLQFMVCGRDTVAVPSSIHCDHLIQARTGADEDLKHAVDENREVYEFLATAASKYGIDFWKPGSGIIHQVVLEQYAFPGGLVVGTDSHTPNAGGLGMIAIGVGGADAVDAMAGLTWGVLCPKITGIRLTGKLSGWASPKDVILKVAGLLTVKGGTGRVVEYFGPGTESISCTGKATITNMGAELGATCSIFPFDSRMAAYLKATERGEVADLAQASAMDLAADADVLNNPRKYFDEVLEIDLSALKPQWVGPHTPDLLHAASEMREFVGKAGIQAEIRSALIGSCTNSSYEDIARASHVVRQARRKGLKVKVPLMVTPGSDQVFRTIERDGFLKDFIDVGAVVLANACGPCIGQWKREDIKKGEKNTIVTSYNRNFAKRNDGNAETSAFIGSPELVTAVALAGRIDFDPEKDSIKTENGQEITLIEPGGDELPARGFVLSRAGFVAPPEDIEARKNLPVVIPPDSERLAFIEVFPPWNGKDFESLAVLMKARGKCTTDHISPAGPWLKYRGHLPRISDNMFSGALNAFTGETGKCTNVLTGEKGQTFAQVARAYKSAGLGWVAIGDENYGEGSSREHAAMSPRHLGCLVIITKSFARIHETNLKKQGILPLTFADPASWEVIGENDKVSIIGITKLAPGSRLTVKLSSGKTFEALHTMTEEQIGWFRAGSALNILRPQGKDAESSGIHR